MSHILGVLCWQKPGWRYVLSAGVRGMARYKAVSLFSGAGGMDVGFKNAGILPVVANEIDADACESYRKNHAGEMLQGDIRLYFGELGRWKGVDFLFGGPPCQGFSVAGKMNPKDDRNSLIGVFADAVNQVEPKAFVCENVKALAVLSKWSGVRASLLSEFAKSYLVNMVVLNSKKFGVPQSRERVFFVGIHRDVCKANRQTAEVVLHKKLEKRMKQAPVLSEVVRTLGAAGSATNSRCCNAKITFARSPVLRRSPYAGMLFNGAGRPLPAFGYASTLPASMGGNKTPIIDDAVFFDSKDSFVEMYHAHLLNGGKPYVGTAPEQLRRMTVDECLAVQSFPKGYFLSGKQSSMYRQIGNAVPCALAEAVARATIETLEALV